MADLAPPEALRRLELTIVRRLEGHLRGDHLGLLPGPGSELAEARPYRAGEDDIRHMDWAVTARTDTPHVRDVVADRELETLALVDLTGSMQFGTTAVNGLGRDKRDLAVAAVATIGVLTNRQGDRFGGAVLTQDGLRRHRARAGRMALYSLVRDLLTQPRHEVEPGRRTDGVPLGPAIDALAAAQPRRGLRVVVSDFLDPGGVLAVGRGSSGGPGAAPSWERPIRRLAVRHQVLAVEVVDPREAELPDVGVVELVDPETGDLLEVDTGRAATRAAFAAAAAAHRERVRTVLRRAGVAHLVLSTDSDWVADTARFVVSHRFTAHQLHRRRT
jgi:uncharacterized protein (DUF58 family)